MEFYINSKTYIDEDSDKLSYKAIYEYNEQQVLNIPWITFNSENLLISGIPSKNDQGSYLIFIEISDDYK